MKRFFKFIFTTTLSCLCLFGTACTQKSECKADSLTDNAVSEHEDLCGPTETNVPEALPAQPPKRPDIPQEPDDSREKNNEDDEDEENRHARPLPIHRGTPKKFLPFDIYFEEEDGQKIIYVIFPYGD